jgi:4-hydroxy-2-oxoheptanedioate aldolase
MKWARQRALQARLFAGAWLNMGSSDTAEIAGLAGYDWVLIDLEHGSGDHKDLLHQLQALEAYPTATVVRVPNIDAVVFKQVLDLGPSGIMVPNVETAEQAHQLISCVRIPPLGKRGAATSTRNSGYGFHYAQYLAEANDNLLVAAQIESRVGLANVEAIAAVDGIDVLFVGPTDLSIDLGLSSDPEQPEFREALVRIATAAEHHGKVAGTLVRNPQQASQYLALGYRFIALGSDRGMVIQGMKANAEFFLTLATAA